VFLCRNSWYTDLSPWSWDNVSRFSMKNLFFVEVIYVSKLGINCTQDPIYNWSKTPGLLWILQGRKFRIDPHPWLSDHLALFLRSWSCSLRSLSWCLVYLSLFFNDLSQTSADLFTCSWMKSVSTSIIKPVWMSCSNNMLKWRNYQLGLLSSKHYILKRMNPTLHLSLLAHSHPFIILEPNDRTYMLPLRCSETVILHILNSPSTRTSTKTLSHIIWWVCNATCLW